MPTTFGAAVNDQNPAVADETLSTLKTMGQACQGIGLRGADAAPLPGAMHIGNPPAPAINIHFATNPAPAPPPPPPLP